MEGYWIAIIALGVLVLIGKVINKINFNRTQKRIDVEIARRKKYYRHPVSSVSDEVARNFR
jgi:hypothetical protein